MERLVDVYVAEAKERTGSVEEAKERSGSSQHASRIQDLATQVCGERDKRGYGKWRGGGGAPIVTNAVLIKTIDLASQRWRDGVIILDVFFCLSRVGFTTRMMMANGY